MKSLEINIVKQLHTEKLIQKYGNINISVIKHNGNNNLRLSELKDKEGSDSLFESNSSLEGTKDNTIFASSSIYAYQAIIADSVSYEGSEFILKAWKEKLTNALTGSFSELEKKFHSDKDLNTDGYQYSSEKITVLVLRHKSNDGSCWINLVIKSK